MTLLEQSALHASLADPILESISFLNEVMDRYPRAVSFAPGAPYAGFFEETDIAALIQRYTAYLAGDKGLSASQIRKHLYQYGPSQGHINDLLAQALRTDEGIDVAPADIVVTVGCQEAILLVLRALRSGPRDVLAVVNPSFAGIVGAARLLDMEILAVAETPQGLDLVRLADDCARLEREGKRVAALYVAPDFSNPSGSVLDLESRRQLLDTAERMDFLVLEDNAYGFTAEREEALPTLKALDHDKRVVYLGTCAKTCMPGVRVGFVVADQPVAGQDGRCMPLAKHLAALKSMVTVNTSPICQAIVGGMLLEHGGSIAALSAPKASLYRGNLDRLLGALDAELRAGPGAVDYVSWNRPAGGFFVRMTLPVAADLELLEYCGAEYGVLWTPMSFFMIGSGPCHELRLSCSYLSHQEIDEGVRRLARFLRDPRVRQDTPRPPWETY